MVEQNVKDDGQSRGAARLPTTGIGSGGGYEFGSSSGRGRPAQLGDVVEEASKGR
jgi:hypothetical protein